MATQTVPPAPVDLRLDRFDDVFNWNHARILQACLECDPEPLNIHPIVTAKSGHPLSDTRSPGWIDRLEIAGLIKVFHERDDPAGHNIEITKAGRIELSRWLKKNPKDPGKAATDAQLLKLAAKMTRQANGIPLSGSPSARDDDDEAPLDKPARPAAPADDDDEADLDAFETAEPPKKKKKAKGNKPAKPA